MSAEVVVVCCCFRCTSASFWSVGKRRTSLSPRMTRQQTSPSTCLTTGPQVGFIQLIQESFTDFSHVVPSLTVTDLLSVHSNDQSNKNICSHGKLLLLLCILSVFWFCSFLHNVSQRENLSEINNLFVKDVTYLWLSSMFTWCLIPP